MYSSLLKYGFEEHIFEVIETCSLEELSLRERYWQEFYDVLDKYKGLNCTLVDTLYQPGEFSKETKEKMRKVGSKGAPTAMAFKQSKRTAKR